MLGFFLWLFSLRDENHAGMRWRTDSVRHDLILSAVVFFAAVALSALLSRLFDDNNQFTVPIFILVVAVIARFMTGYRYGVIASVLSVLCVNFFFTYPYFTFTLREVGYPLTFAAMLAVSISIGTLTTQIKRQEKLRVAVEMEKMRANLLRAVSHDLRTPLTSIIGSSAVLLENGELSERERSELLGEINKDARWLSRITENLLSVTKFSGENVNLNLEEEVIEEIVSSAIVKFRRSHENLRIDVIRPEKILCAPVDATLIEQVILNLFDNAVEHGKTTSRIRVEITGDADCVRVAVSDNGAGIAAGRMQHLFDGQMPSEHSDDRRNMGIGLSVCRSIIRAHGGDISAHNNPAGGACVEFRLPTGEDADIEHFEE